MNEVVMSAFFRLSLSIVCREKPGCVLELGNLFLVTKKGKRLLGWQLASSSPTRSHNSTEFSPSVNEQGGH